MITHLSSSLSLMGLVAALVAGCVESTPFRGTSDAADAGGAADAADAAVAPGCPGGCDDDLACTVDRCDETSGCVHEPKDNLCDADEDPCTTAMCVPGDGCTQVPVADYTPCLGDSDDCTWDACFLRTCGVPRRGETEFDGALRGVVATPEGFVMTGSELGGGLLRWYRGDGTLARSTPVSPQESGSVEEIAGVVALTDGFMVAGTITVDGLGTRGWLARIEANGDVRWDKPYGDASGGGFEALAVLGDGVVAVGSLEQGGDERYPWMVTVDSDGNVVGDVTETSLGTGTAMAVAVEGGAVVWAGGGGLTALSDAHAFGGQLGEGGWARDFTGIYAEAMLWGATATGQGTVVMAGSAKLGDLELGAARLLAVDAAGEVVWDWLHSELKVLYDVVTTPWGLAGAGAVPSGPVLTSIALLRTDAAGQNPTVARESGVVLAQGSGRTLAPLVDGGLVLLGRVDVTTSVIRIYPAGTDGGMCGTE